MPPVMVGSCVGEMSVMSSGYTLQTVSKFHASTYAYYTTVQEVAAALVRCGVPEPDLQDLDKVPYLEFTFSYWKFLVYKTLNLKSAL